MWLQVHWHTLLPCFGDSCSSDVAGVHVQTDFERWFVMMNRQQQQQLLLPQPLSAVAEAAACATLLPAASPLTKANDAASVAADNPALAATVRDLPGHGVRHSSTATNNNVSGSNTRQPPHRAGEGCIASAEVPPEVLSAAKPFLTGDAQADKDILGFYLARNQILRVGR